MKLSEIGELSLIETIRNRFARPTSALAEKNKNIIVGIGDDAAVIRPSGKNMLLTTDMMVEGIHFDLGFVTPYQLGYKLVSVNVSDIYAMGGTPHYLLLDIAMTKDTEKSFIDSFFDGIHDSMKLYNVFLTGGDVSSSKKDIVVAASVVGYAEKPIRRSTARPGDKIYVTGNLGDSACGLEILKKAVRCKTSAADKKVTRESYPLIPNFKKTGLTWNTIAPLLIRHLMPVARNPKGFVRHATSMIDLSDGLFIDLSRLCAESRVGAVIYREHIPVSAQTRKISSMLRLDSFNLATAGGEDYELLFTAPENTRIPSPLKKGSRETIITCIGEITISGKKVMDKKGRAIAFPAAGYQHFGIKRQT